jgi:hypothetical protein
LSAAGREYRANTEAEVDKTRASNPGERGAGYWFLVLERARRVQDVEAAIEAMGALARLGVDVKFRSDRLTEPSEHKA